MNAGRGTVTLTPRVWAGTSVLEGGPGAGTGDGGGQSGSTCPEQVGSRSALALATLTLSPEKPELWSAAGLSSSLNVRS